MDVGRRRPQFRLCICSHRSNRELQSLKIRIKFENLNYCEKFGKIFFDYSPSRLATPAGCCGAGACSSGAAGGCAVGGAAAADGAGAAVVGAVGAAAGAAGGCGVAVAVVAAADGA